jgi:uncharacterized OB-fold protein
MTGLLVPRCSACDNRFWYDRPFCANCGSREIARDPHPGNGQIYSYTVVRKNPSPGTPPTPYVFGFVELDNGPRLLALLHAALPDEVRVGDPVRLVEAAPDSTAAPEFHVEPRR